MAEPTTLESKLDALRDALLRLESVVVAYSGGFDSVLWTRCPDYATGTRKGSDGDPYGQYRLERHPDRFNCIITPSARVLKSWGSPRKG